MYVCTICNLFAGKTFSAVLRHMGTHRFDCGLLIRCGINSCAEKYKNFESFRSHVYRKHREALIPPSPLPPLTPNNGPVIVNEASSSSFDNPEDEDLITEEKEQNYDDCQKKLAAKFT